MNKAINEKLLEEFQKGFIIKTNEDHLGRTIDAAEIEMKSCYSAKHIDYRIFIFEQVKLFIPAFWIIQLSVLSIALLLWIFITSRYPILDDPRIMVLFVGCLSVFIATSSVSLMIRSQKYGMLETEMSTMISARRLFVIRLFIVGFVDCITILVVLISMNAISQYNIPNITVSILTPFLLAIFAGLNTIIYANNEYMSTIITATGIFICIILLAVCRFIPNIHIVLSSHIGVMLCLLLFALSVYQMNKLTVICSTMDSINEMNFNGGI